MDQITDVVNLKQVCRTCLLSSKTMSSVFSSIKVPNLEFSKLQILDLLSLFTDISVSPNDGLPDNICSECISKIYQSYTYKWKCEKSDAFLKKLKMDEKCVIDFKNSAHQQETGIVPIKTEPTEHEASYDEESKLRDLSSYFDHEKNSQEISIVQEFKQEPEIEIYTQDIDEHLENNTQCSVCSKVFKSKQYLKIHTRIHSGEKPFKCQICEKEFGFKRNLKKHMITSHADKTSNESKATCPICSRIFLYKYLLDRHMLIHTADKPFQCELCPIKFRYKHVLKSHMMKTHSIGTTSANRKFDCTTCSRSFAVQSDLNRHIRIHTGEKPFQCEVCPKKFRLKKDLKSHTQRIHILKKEKKRAATEKAKKLQFECPTCSKLFQHKYLMNQHMIQHSTERPYQCDICMKKFGLQQTLKCHIQNVHSDDTVINKKLKCSICSKLFRFKSDLMQHMRTHSEEKAFRCELCPNIYRFKSNLTVHIQRIHLRKNQTFSCTTCSKVFGIKSDLNKHVRIHTGERPYLCEICPANYRYSRNLKEHIQKMHDTTVDTELKCSICSKLFRFKSDLMRHMPIHSEKKTFRCKLCLKMYRYKSNLKKHMQIHSGEKPYLCEICPAYYRHRRNLKEHIKEMHAVEGESDGKQQSVQGIDMPVKE